MQAAGERITDKKNRKRSLKRTEYGGKRRIESSEETKTKKRERDFVRFYFGGVARRAPRSGAVELQRHPLHFGPFDCPQDFTRLETTIKFWRFFSFSFCDFCFYFLEFSIYRGPLLPPLYMSTVRIAVSKAAPAAIRASVNGKSAPVFFRAIFLFARV